MTLNFVKKIMSLGGGNSPLQFYKKGFELGKTGGTSEPKYLKDSDGLYLISSDNLKLMVRG